MVYTRQQEMFGWTSHGTAKRYGNWVCQTRLVWGFSYSLGTVIQLWEDNKSPAQLCITLHYNLHIIVYILI